ncbi:MAG: P1 family peptidase [Lachnospiraceae bacterium]|nr:P1 family peptidase [Lachnospiraceae bacterium]
MRDISINDIEDFRIGQTENKEAGTGCTVIISEKGVAAGVDIRGGGPASRECELLRPFSTAEVIHALVLGGGSTFGLDASGGVLKYLEEKGVGFDMGITHIPQVCQSDIFDLTVGDAMIRPDKEMGYQACINSEKRNYKDGNYGAGCGATVGKWMGMDQCMKTGIGSAAVSLDTKEGELKLGAVVAVNAIGDIFDPDNGKMIAGLLSEDGRSFLNTEQMMYEAAEIKDNSFAGNTTIGAILTNAAFDKIKLSKIASMAHNGYARCIRPVHTAMDGDSIYALSSGKVKADIDMIGTLAAHVMSMAIVKAVKRAKGAYGHPGYADMDLA